MKKHRILTGILTLIFIYFIFSLNALSQQNDPDDPINSLEWKIDSLVTNSKLIPGVAIAIVKRDSLTQIITAGFSDLQNNTPVTENTLFCIGSCTKSFIGLAYLKLIEEGKININASIRKLVPEIQIKNPWSDTHPVRVIHLLEHSSGFEDSRPNWFYFNKPLLSIREALEKKKYLLKARWEPGTRFSYSSPGYTLAGYILEKVAGQSFNDFIKEKIFIPVGMKTVSYGNAAKDNEQLATGYDKLLREYPIWYDLDEPAGAINASIRDMANFLILILNEGRIENTAIIPQDLFNRIGKPVSTLASLSGISSGYSYGVGVTYKYGLKWLGHSGAVPGFLSAYYYCPEKGIGFAILQNQFDMTFDEEVFSEVWRYMKEMLESKTDAQDDIQPSGDHKEFEGYYEPRNPRVRIGQFIEIITGGIHVVSKNDTLFTKGFMEVGIPLYSVSGNLFRRAGNPEATAVFATDEDGDMIFTSARKYYQRVSPWKPILSRVVFFGGWIFILSMIPYLLTGGIILIVRGIRHKDCRVYWLNIKLLPLLALLSLIGGMIPFMISQPTILEIGQMSLSNIFLFITTLLFLVFSVIGVYLYFKYWRKPVRIITRIYFASVLLSCIGMSFYMSFWGIIGIRLWA